MDIHIHVEKKHLYFFALVLVLFTGIFLVKAAQNDPGHSWGQMDCDTDFCIGSSGVGIGTTTPSTKLTVDGDVRVLGGLLSGDISVGDTLSVGGNSNLWQDDYELNLKAFNAFGYTTKINIIGDLEVSSLSGAGDATVCVDSDGNLYRC